MIRKAAIDAFLQRKLANYDWLKQENPIHLDAELGPNPLKLWRHQMVALILIEELKRFMLHLDMGAGKTLITLALIQRRKQRGERPRAIVFVPYITSVETWVEECAKHTSGLKCVPLLGTTMENADNLHREGDLFVICYQSAVAMLSTRKPKKWELSAAEVRERFAGFDMLVCDEIHKAKGHLSLTFRMCRAISKRCQWVLGLTGTPFGKDLQDLWAQFFLVDGGETLGETLGFYRAVFFNDKPGYWGGTEYTFKKKLLPNLKRIIKHKSIHYGLDEFADMPPKEYIYRRLHAPEASRSYVKAAMESIHEGVKKQSFQLVESSYLQLRQLSSGFMTLKGEDSGRIQIKFDANPKLDALAEIVEALPSGRKVVIFHHFVFSSQLISERLTEMKVPHARIWGGQRDPIGELRKFKADPKCLALVLNDNSGSSSLNLQLASYLIFFEEPDSPITRQQAEARVYRPGQLHKCLVYDLIVKGTVDEQMKASNREGENLLQALLRGRRLAE
jgi:SNF2 family DNA or RNA helicase